MLLVSYGPVTYEHRSQRLTITRIRRSAESFPVCLNHMSLYRLTKGHPWVRTPVGTALYCLPAMSSHGDRLFHVTLKLVSILPIHRPLLMSRIVPVTRQTAGS